MTYSPAAIITVFARSEVHRTQRLAVLEERVGARIDMRRRTVHDLASDCGGPSSPLEMVVRDDNRGLPFAVGGLFVNHPGGEHTNVCLAAERDLMLDLLRDEVIDTVEFSVGLPKTNPRLFVGKYEAATICGKRGFVALRIALSAMFPNVEVLASPMTELLRDHWREIASADDSVEVDRKRQASFLRSCSSLPYFNGWVEALAVAAKRVR